jgi:flavorubredoxin
MVSDAISRVVPLAKLRHVGLSHVEADECGGLNAFLAVAPQTVAFCSAIAVMTSVNDFASGRRAHCATSKS